MTSCHPPTAWLKTARSSEGARACRMVHRRRVPECGKWNLGFKMSISPRHAVRPRSRPRPSVCCVSASDSTLEHGDAEGTVKVQRAVSSRHRAENLEGPSVQRSAQALARR